MEHTAILLGVESTLVGWAIKQGKVMQSSKEKAVVGLKESPVFSGTTCSHWTVLPFFAKKVCLFTPFITYQH